MNDPVISRQAIAADADAAAQRAVQFGAPQQNPHESGTEAHACWKAAYERYLLLHSTGETSA